MGEKPWMDTKTCSVKSNCSKTGTPLEEEKNTKTSLNTRSASNVTFNKSFTELLTLSPTPTTLVNVTEPTVLDGLPPCQEPSNSTCVPPLMERPHTGSNVNTSLKITSTSSLDSDLLSLENHPT